MTTRSGKNYTAMSDREETAVHTAGDQEAAAGVSRGTPLPSREPVSVEEMLRVMIEDRKRREEEIADERLRQREENERRMAEMREQVQMLQRLVTERATITPTRTRGEGDSARLTRLSDSDDIEAYLNTFERMMEAFEVDRARWPYKLAPQLTGKAQQAYAALSLDEARDYDAVKAAILRRYNINEETYRQRFRGATLKSGETPRELVTRLHDLVRRWGKECKSAQDVFDIMIREQLLNTLPEEVRVWVTERKPRSREEAGQLAEDYLQARGATQGTSKPVKSERQPPGNCPRCRKPGHWAKHCPNPRQSSTGSSSLGTRTDRDGGRDGPVCYTCHKRGHIAVNCPSKTTLYCDRGDASGRRDSPDEVYRSGTVNGTPVQDLLLDTGAARTLVRSNLVPPNCLVNGEVTIRCAHGDTVIYPLAEARICVGGRELTVLAAVSDTLPVSMLLGRDVPELMALLGKEPTKETKPQTDPIDHDVLAVTTRAQAAQQDWEEEQLQEREEASGAHAASLDDTVAGETDPSGDDAPTFNFDDSIFIESPAKPWMSRQEKRENNRRYSSTNATDNGRHPLDLSTDELRQLQEQDSTLQAVREAAQGTGSTAGRVFFVRDGLIYRRYVPPGGGDEEAVDQLVLPTQCRETVLELAHSIPLAGHLGKAKTTRRVTQRFYWPSLYADVARFCKACPSCQKTSTKRSPRAPLVPLPIIEEPFRRIAMDIVGPLPRSRSGKKYILVVCDYATRYPEAIPLRSIDASSVAEELMQLFARVGVPKEILTDQGSNFTSQLLTELYKLLHIKPIRTSPYHPQTDGLVERFNQTRKAMLKKTAVDEGKDWDKLLPYLLFAYREVLQASTGFSPFELLYGWQVRGPLDILKESWQEDKRSSESVVSYVLGVRRNYPH